MRRSLIAGLVVAVIALLGGAAFWLSSGDDPAPPSFDQLLAEMEGRPLSPVEVADRREVGEMLCSLDDPLLSAVWQQVETEQLPFHDIVVAGLCPERSALYAARTGRLITLTVDGLSVDTSGGATTVAPQPTNPAPASTEPPTTNADQGTTTTTGDTTVTDTTEPVDGTEPTTEPSTEPTTSTEPAEGSDTTVDGDDDSTVPPPEDVFTTTTAEPTTTVTLDPGT